LETVFANNRGYLAFLRDIGEVSAACGTRTYIWGGFTIDILEGYFIREHHDLDGFTLNLLDVLPEMIALYTVRGYATEFREDIDMLTIRKGDLHASFNRLEVDGSIAMWRHIGDEGTVYFPVDWLDAAPRDFYGVNVYSAGLELDYTLKTNIRMIHATWTLREQDCAAIAVLERMMAQRDLDPEDFLRHVWSFNPYWVKHGYPEYAMPTVARPLLSPHP
jgi:hypothetical protein